VTDFNELLLRISNKKLYDCLEIDTIYILSI
jgi:hypothetical protein